MSTVLSFYRTRHLLIHLFFCIDDSLRLNQFHVHPELERLQVRVTKHYLNVTGKKLHFYIFKFIINTNSFTFRSRSLISIYFHGLSVYLDALVCVLPPVHLCFCLLLSERICAASIFSLCFCETFSNLSPAHPPSMLLWRTLEPQRGVTMPHCAAMYSQTNQGHSTGYINTTATLLRPSHRDETHVNFSEGFQCSGRAEMPYHRLLSEFIASALFSSVGGCSQWNVRYNLSAVVPVFGCSEYFSTESNLIWIFSSDKSVFSQHWPHVWSF